MTRFSIHLTAVIFCLVFSASAFSHAGPHENKNCFITMGSNILRFSGYQFQGVHPEQALCRIFPELGSLLIKIEPVNEEATQQQVGLQLLKLNSGFNGFSIVKETPLHSLNNGVNMLQAEIQQRGIYALNLKLQGQDKKIVTQRFLFLAGIPITKLLVLFSGGILCLLAVIFIIQYTGILKKILTIG